MNWHFETDESFQRELDWMSQFVSEEVEPLEHVLRSHYEVSNPANIRLVRPLQAEVRRRNLWACHLEPELGGRGFGQLKLALMNEILGRTRFGPVVFGCQAPDTGNAEILARFGTEEQKRRYLQPLLENEVVSCFSMTEPQGGADPLVFRTAAVQHGDYWQIDGEKWFSSNANWADFLLVVAVTDPLGEPHRRMSMFIVPRDAPGLELIRNVGFGTEVPSHCYLRYNGVRVPLSHMLGGRGDAFLIAQTRLGGGRIHHAMRTVGLAAKALEMMCSRAVSRSTKGERLADKQMVQEKIADSWIELEQFRLLVLRTAWRIDQYRDYRRVLRDIAAVKAAMPKVLHDISARALHLHGSLGLSNEMPFLYYVAQSFHVGIADGPTEVHKVTVARQTLRGLEPDDPIFPSYHIPKLRQQAQQKFAALLDDLVLAGAD
jgi:acyl-CoA dehydrogenase